MSIRSGHGCFGYGTRMMLSSGTEVAVQDIRVGDRLMGSNGASARNVLALCRGQENLYQFTYSDGGTHVFNESHILCLVATNSKGRRKAGAKTTVTVREWLRWGADKKRCHAVYRSPVTTYERYRSPLPIPPYILGVWLGDGSTRDTRVTSADQEVIDELNGYALSIGLTLKAGEKKGKATAWNVSGTRGKGHVNPMLDALRALGVLGDKHVPDVYRFASRADRLELLAGLIDTDGSLMNAGAGFDFVQKSERIARSVVDLARSVGCHATMQACKKTCVNNGVVGDYFRVCIGRNIDAIPIRIARKRAHGHRQRPNLHFGIAKVVPLGMGDYFGFELDGDHTFLGADHTVLHNTGKSAFMAWTILWGMVCFKEVKIPVTAPTGHQLEDILWSELAKWHRRMPEPLRSQFEHTATKFYRIEAPEQAFSVPRTSRKEQPEALQGFHAATVIFLIDEASGIADEVFQVAEGALSTEGAYVLMAANPTRMEGYFHASHHKDRGQWAALHWNGEESPLVSRDYVAGMAEKYGETSSIYRIRVRGDFAGNPDGVISLDLVEAAVLRRVTPFGPRRWGVDVARFGIDRTALAKRWGNVLTQKVKWWHGKDTMQVAGLILTEYVETPPNEKPEAICIDVIGLGAGVVDRCKEMNLPVVGINVAESPAIKDQFNRLRDELWFDARDWFTARDCSMPEDDDLTAELTLPGFRVLSNGKKKVQDKDELKKLGMTSPDLADAFCLTFAKQGASLRRRAPVSVYQPPLDAEMGY